LKADATNASRVAYYTDFSLYKYRARREISFRDVVQAGNFISIDFIKLFY
jgi:hypothetical protein